MTRRLIAFAVVGALVCGQVLAYADPPDPTWIAGFWDDADFDDVIVRITSTSSVTETGLSSSLEPHWAPIWTVPVATTGWIRARPSLRTSLEVLRSPDLRAGWLPNMVAA